jgi:protein SCO1
MARMRKLQIVLWTLAALAVLFAGAAYVTRDLALVPPRAGDAVRIGGAFSMTDQNGRAVTEQTYAGKARAMFFGFTYCPDICPTTLTRMTQLMGQLGADADKLQVILVSVDPERDTPEVLKPYVEAFDTRFVALTGTPQQLADFAASYRFITRKYRWEMVLIIRWTIQRVSTFMMSQGHSRERLIHMRAMA